MPKDNPTWTKAAPTFEYLEPPTLYSPMIIPSFNKEEYVNRPKEDEAANDVVAPSDEAAQLAGEVTHDVMALSDKAA